MGSLIFLGFLLFLSLLSLFSSLSSSTSPAAAADKAALLAFKLAVAIDPSGVLSGWDPMSQNHCEWHGITCEEASGRVTGLELAGTPASRLTGSLTSEIGNLTNLRFLSLPQNNFSGDITVVSFGVLRRLEVIDLSDNNFSGRIPDQIGLLSSLVVLDLAYNSLQGPIPAGLIGLPSLTSVDLSFNRLSGGIKVNPTGDCRSLIHLKLTGNFLVDKIPPELGKCSNLRTLLLDGNILEGRIPAALGWLAELRTLDVSLNSLTGRIPRELSFCLHLSVLVLTNLIGSPVSTSLPPLDSSTTEEFNAFIGSIPMEVITVPSLEILWAPRANLDGLLPDFRNSSCTLRILNLGQNYITGGMPDWLGLCKNLTFLDLSSNFLKGPVPVTLGVQCMTFFNVSRNALSGPLVGLSESSCTMNLFSKSRVASMLHQEEDLLKIYSEILLQSIQEASPFRSVLNVNSLILHDFGWNGFNGSVPYFELPIDGSLSYGLLMNNNGFNGTLDNGFWKFCEGLGGFAVNLSSNQISGEIGKLSNCTQIRSFEAAVNHLSGSIPSDIGNLLSLAFIDLRMNNLNGSVTEQLGRLNHVEGVLLGGNAFYGAIPDQLGSMVSLRILDLSRNSLAGAIPSSLADATNLQMLLLDDNRLSGEIPPSFSKLSRLKTLNVSCNNLSGLIPQLVHVTDCNLFKGNHFLEPCPNSNATYPTGLPSDSEIPKSNGKKNKLKYLVVAFVAFATLVVVVLVVMVIFLITRRRMTVKPSIGSKIVVTFTGSSAELTYDNILKATGNFSIQNLIGTGGFGATYKAELRPGYFVAVKRLYMSRFQGLKQFNAEIRTLGRIRHKNLVTLLGYHMGEVDTFLIYNFLPAGNLEAFIQNISGKDIHWAVIHKIALDVALALSYLHYSCLPRIVHRDIKPSNILLDEKLNAYLSDFGLARLLEVSQTHATTDVAGTFGYVAPEYATTCKVSDKADVYSFGVVLLELLSGKRSLDPSFSDYGDGFNIVAWARLMIHEDRLGELLYSSLWESGPKDKLLEIVRVSLACTAESLSIRPSMKKVVETLQKISK
ncbi:LRR receptor-like serine/threonine-protein kinase RPK2 [Apostasia shenzhenica]|uniref:non-specific serine/threonine protein kinase n=1 Tax=Apostasia shenzhenica TaxID=1088818 RepID=A0A2I0AMU5_9ASPA|nr:LRR receptor-like serine/threonine-protein kinase RPK2 [Apostasia shenzhenica]